MAVGDATFPVLTSDPAAGTPAENAAQAETTGAFSADVLSPGRIQASFFSGAVKMRLAWLAWVTRSEKPWGAAYRDKLDSEIMRGTNGLLTGTILEQPQCTGTVTAILRLHTSDFAYYGRVDGRYAASGCGRGRHPGSHGLVPPIGNAGGQKRPDQW